MSGVAAGSAAIRVRDVTKTYDAIDGRVVPAIANVSLSVDAGEFVSIVGRSGCGKSTLLRMIAGLMSVQRGTIELSDGPVSGPPDQVRYVFQDYSQSLLPWKTVRANVAFGIRHGTPKGRQQPWSVDELLEMVGLSHAADRYPSEMSGGMQQRLAIVRAIASQPAILLMDEPFSAVDALSRANLQDALLAIWARFSLTVLFVTHDVDEAIYLSDRIVVLDPHGRGVLSSTETGIARPRDQVATRELPRYLALRRQIFSQVRGDA